VSREVINTWDAETRAKAKEQSRNIRRDKEAQMMLEAHIAASSPVAQDSDIHSTRFNPMRLYARMAHFYHGFSDTDLRQMHYPRFFAYIREANVLIEEQREAQAQHNNSNNRNHGHGNAQVVHDPEIANLEILRRFGKPQQYQGETVKLND